MNKVCVIGDVNVDIVSILREPLQNNSDTQTTNSLNLGGSPCNMSMWLAHIGADVTFIAAIGDDLLGNWISSQLHTGGLNTNNLKVIKNSSSGTCIILVDQAGQRTMLPDPGANLHLALRDNQRLIIQESSVVVLSAYTFFREETRELALQVVDLVKNSTSRLVIDAASSSPILETGVALVQEFLSNADLILANEDEFAAIQDSNWLASQCDIIKKLGSNGSSWFRFGSEICSVPAISQSALDTTGAGDSFLAGLVSVLAQHQDWFAIDNEDRKIALERGSQVAALNIEKIGAGPSSIIK